MTNRPVHVIENRMLHVNSSRSDEFLGGGCDLIDDLTLRSLDEHPFGHPPLVRFSESTPDDLENYCLRNGPRDVSPCKEALQKQQEPNEVNENPLALLPSPIHYKCSLKQPQWVVPMGSIIGCPPGLEYLTQVDQILVHQVVELLEAFTGWETKNRYVLKNSLGQQVFYAMEESDLCMRQCCGPARAFIIHITDNMGQEVMLIRRQFKCCGGCCWFAACRQCSYEVSIEAPVGHVIAYVTQDCSAWRPRFVIHSAEAVILKNDLKTQSNATAEPLMLPPYSLNDETNHHQQQQIHNINYNKRFGGNMGKNIRNVDSGDGEEQVEDAVSHSEFLMGEPELLIKGPVCVCQGAWCCEQDFTVLSSDGEYEVGKISKQFSGLIKEYFTDADNFGVQFPIDLEVKLKAAMIGAVFLIDFMFFENESNSRNS